MIQHEFLPKVTGRVNELEREMMNLPARLGGLGIRNPVLTADQNFEASQKITETLTELIVRQEGDFAEFDNEAFQKTKSEVIAKKRLREKMEKQA